MTNMLTFFALVLFALSGSVALADDPAISWALKDAMRQVDAQADDFESAMARNLKLNPDLFKRNWPRGTKKQKVR